MESRILEKMDLMQYFNDRFFKKIGVNVCEMEHCSWFLYAIKWGDLIRNCIYLQEGDTRVSDYMADSCRLIVVNRRFKIIKIYNSCGLCLTLGWISGWRNIFIKIGYFAWE